jgi:hypothetical protein
VPLERSHPAPLPVDAAPAAHRAFSGFLDKSDFPDEMRRRQAERALRDLEPLVGRLLISVPYRDGASVLVDKEHVGLAPLPYAIAVEPGVHEITAVVDDKEVVHEQVTAGPGKLTKVKLWRARGQVVALPHMRRPGDPPAEELLDAGAGTRRPKRTPANKRWWLWTAVGAVAAGAVLLYATTRSDTINDVNPTFGRFSFDEF